MNPDVTGEIMWCQNCGGTDHAKHRSYDLDLPVLLLCDLCAVALVTDFELFERMRQQR